MDASYVIAFVADETPSVRRVHEWCLDHGLTTTHDGRTDTCEEYSIDLTLQRDEDVEVALSDLERAERGVLYVWTESGMKLGIAFSDAEKRGEFWGRVRISFQTHQIDRNYDEASVETRIDELIHLVGGLTPVVNPEYVWSAVTDENEEYKRVIPTGRPIADNLGERDGASDLSWITVLSEDVVEQFGGREHVLQTPTWQIREYETGHIMLVLRDHPYDPTERPDGSWKRHLLGDN